MAGWKKGSKLKDVRCEAMWTATEMGVKPQGAGLQGPHTVAVLRGPQAAKKRQLKKLLATLELVHFLYMELAHSQECSPSNMDTAGKAKK